MRSHKSRITIGLNMRTAVLLASSLLFGMTAPCQTNAPPLAADRAKFEVASVRANTSGTNLVMIQPPVGGRFTATNAPLKSLLALAYDVPNFAISGGSGWIQTAGFDVEGKTSDPKLTMDAVRPLLQSLLEDRFQLKVRRETNEAPIYVLTLPKGPSKISESREGSCADKTSDKPSPLLTPGRRSGGTSGVTLPAPQCGAPYWTPTHLDAAGISMSRFARTLTDILTTPVIDKTGFTGGFDVRLEFRSEDSTSSQMPSIFVVLEEQLGIKLQSQKGPEDMLVIEHAEKPTEN